MPASAVKKRTNEKKRIFKPKKTLNSVLIQDYKLLVIFQVFASKMATIPRL